MRKRGVVYSLRYLVVQDHDIIIRFSVSNRVFSINLLSPAFSTPRRVVRPRMAHSQRISASIAYPSRICRPRAHLTHSKPITRPPLSINSSRHGHLPIHLGSRSESGQTHRRVDPRCRCFVRRVLSCSLLSWIEVRTGRSRTVV